MLGFEEWWTLLLGRLSVWLALLAACGLCTHVDSVFVCVSLCEVMGMYVKRRVIRAVDGSIFVCKIARNYENNSTEG